MSADGSGYFINKSDYSYPVPKTNYEYGVFGSVTKGDQQKTSSAHWRFPESPDTDEHNERLDNGQMSIRSHDAKLLGTHVVEPRPFVHSGLSITNAGHHLYPDNPHMHRSGPCPTCLRDLPIPKTRMSSYSPNPLNPPKGTTLNPLDSSSTRVSPNRLHHSPIDQPQKANSSTLPKSLVENESSRQEPSDSHEQKEIEEEFCRLIPYMNTVDMFKFDDLAVQMLMNCDDSFTLDEFYDLIFNPKHTTYKFVYNGRFHTFDISQHFSFGSKGLKLNAIVLGFLRSPENTICQIRGKNIDNLRRPTINLHEFSRALLAVRILQASVRKITQKEDQHLSLPRDDIYRAYCILCQKSILQHSESFDSQNLIDELTLCKSRVGKLAKLLFVGFSQRRLGKRGKSKFHLVGVKWNDAVIDDETIKMIISRTSNISSGKKSILSTDMTESATSISRATADHFKLPSRPVSKPVPQPVVSSIPHSQHKKMPTFSQSPRYSFIGPTTRFPEQDCRVRDWTRVPGKPPKQSPWAAQLMQESIYAFSSYGLDLNPVIRHFDSGIYIVDGPDSLPVAVTGVVSRLCQIMAPPRAFFHFYLVFLLLVFPPIIASDVEVSAIQKLRLRTSINMVITELETDKILSTPSDERGVVKFTKILRSMRSLGELASTTIKSVFFEDVMRVLGSHIGSLWLEGDGTSEGTEIYKDAFFRGFVISTKAFGFEAPSLISSTSSTAGSADDIAGALAHMGKEFSRSTLTFKDEFAAILDEFHKQKVTTPTQPLAYELFMRSTSIIHRDCILHPAIRKLPMRMFTFILQQLMMSLQKICFHEFGKHDPELSRESFKTWYVMFASIHEYMRVLCEIIALNETLTESTNFL